MNIRDLSGDELLVFETLQKGRPATKKDLESRLGWTASTTNRVIQSLLQKGGVMETGQLESSGGRRPSLFDIQAQQGCLLGIHISFGFVRMVLCDLKMRPLEREVLLVPPVRESPETVLESIAGTYREFLRRQKRQPRPGTYRRKRLNLLPRYGLPPTIFWHASHSTILSFPTITTWQAPLPARFPKRRAVPTTRCSSMAASVWERPICFMPSATG